MEWCWHSYLKRSICSMSKWGKWGTEMFPQLWKFGTKGINKNLLQFVTPLYQGLNFLNLISSCFLRNFLQLTHPIVKTEFLSILTKKLYLTSIRRGRKKLYLSQVLLDFRHGQAKKIVLDFYKDRTKTKNVLWLPPGEVINLAGPLGPSVRGRQEETQVTILERLQIQRQHF